MAQKECRYCLMAEPVTDLIKPCSCNSHAHRACLDRWRALSPHKDAMYACEVCRSSFQIIKRGGSNNDGAKCKYAALVALDIVFFAAVVVLLWLAFGWVGDMAFNNLVEESVGCGPYFNSPNRLYKNTTTPCSIFQFTGNSLFSGRIWFWGFICLFFVLGIIGCCVYCFCGEEGIQAQDSGSTPYTGSSDCYWICCGPSYYNGYYYSNPYSYWTSNDILCCWMCYDLNTHHYYHHHSGAATGCNGCTACNCGSGNCCSGDCNGCGNCGGSDKDGLSVLVIILLIVVIIFVVCGVIFGAVIGFLLINKILRRHMYILQQKEEAATNVVADLDDPAQVSRASPAEIPQVDTTTTTKYEETNPLKKGYVDV